MAAFLELKEVSFAAQTRVVIKNISHQFDEGTSTALVGASGSGKSTLLKLAAGVLLPTHGEVLFKGKNVFNMSRHENLEFHRMGAVVFQDSALWANQSLHQILELPLNLHFPNMPPKEKEERIQEVVRAVGYKRDLSIRPAALSAGEQKLIAFARAIILRPTLLFLDEWTESMDESAARRLINLVKARQKAGNTVIFVCQEYALVRDMADFVLMIKGEGSYLKISREQMETNEDLAKFIEEGLAS